MQTLIQPKAIIKMANVENSTYAVKEKFNNPKLSLVLKFYQKLFVIIFMFVVMELALISFQNMICLD